MWAASTWCRAACSPGREGAPASGGAAADAGSPCRRWTCFMQSCTGYAVAVTANPRSALPCAVHAEGGAQASQRSGGGGAEEHPGVQGAGTDHAHLHGAQWCAAAILGAGGLCRLRRGGCRAAVCCRAVVCGLTVFAWSRRAACYWACRPAAAQNHLSKQPALTHCHPHPPRPRPAQA